ncbi:hypothetical protein NLX62_08190, partial [Mycobacteriaceae bacterium Msp059]|nr:hypothetical protein [Mycobacteriaceae bacterium Msp059]
NCARSALSEPLVRAVRVVRVLVRSVLDAGRLSRATEQDSPNDAHSEFAHEAHFQVSDRPNSSVMPPVEH